MDYKLNKLAVEIYEGNKLNGFDVAKENKGQTLMLIVSELSEALEADRIDKHASLELFGLDLSHGVDFKKAFEHRIKDTFQDELIDALIRTLDACGGMGIDIESHMNLKRRYNAMRGAYRHGKKY